jgi:hypothetical protein
MLRINQAQFPGHHGAEVTTVGNIAVVLKPIHQFRHNCGDPPDAPACISGGTGKSKAGRRGNNDVKSVCRITAMRTRIGERADERQELHDRAGPAMSKQ